MDLDKYRQAIDIGPRTIFELPEVSEIMDESRKWVSYFEGILMYFDPNKQDMIDENIVSDYINWCYRNVPILDNELFTRSFDEPRFLVAYNELTFHILNYAMITMWGGFFDTKNQEISGNRNYLIKDAQDMLSLAGSRLYIYRDPQCSAQSDYSFFHKDNSAISSAINGRLTEIDAGIALLDYAKINPHIIVVPSQGAFERFASSANTDFILYDTKNVNIIGAQVKSMGQKADFERYDTSRVALISGRYDLENELLTRTKTGTSQQKVISWPGMISMAHINGIHTIGKNRSIVVKYSNPSELMQLKFRAKTMLKGLRVNRQRILSNISYRLDKTFAYNQGPNT